MACTHPGMFLIRLQIVLENHFPAFKRNVSTI